MLDIAPSEFLLVALVALVVIGPKDLPKALRVVGYWVGKARGVARQFRQGFDNMVREAELEDMEKRWKAENERIMREHPPEPDAPHAAASSDSGELKGPRNQDAAVDGGPDPDRPDVAATETSTPAPHRDIASS